MEGRTYGFNIRSQLLKLFVVFPAVSALAARPAYLQALLFLEVMNWYDGIVIDRLWAGHDRFWIIPGTEDIPFVQTWKEVLK